MKKKRVKKTKKSRKLLYLFIGIIAVIGLVILIALLIPQYGADKIKGITIGNTYIQCGVSDSICPSEYAGCEKCYIPDPDCINVCGW